MRYAPRTLIGVTTKDIVDESRPAGDHLVYIVSGHYPKAIRQSGASSILMPVMAGPDCVLSLADLRALYHQVDGLILTGGNDVNPRLYGEPPLSTTEAWSDNRDTTEKHLISWAKEDKKPLLAICRGMQILNVALGGSLRQHLDNQPIDHSNEQKPLTERLHPIKLAIGSRLHQALSSIDNKAIQGDSHHHQGIRRLGSELSPVAWAHDDLIEAVESTDSAWYAIGVQWHPELMAEEFKGLFNDFVGAAKSWGAALAG